MDKLKKVLSSIDKKTYILLICGFGGIVLLIILLSVLSRCSMETYSTYEKVEEMLVSAAQQYYNERTGMLPKTSGETATVSYNTLAVGGYIKPFNELLENGDKCSAEVIVTNLNNTYEYIPYLNCGTDYVSIDLYKRVLEDNEIVTAGAGLYEIDGEKVFRGEVKNNYVSLDKNLWRIVRIDENNNLVLLSQFKTETYPWDDRYNSETESNDGINNFDLSRLKDTLNDIFYSDEILKSSTRSKVVYTKACIGVRNIDDSASYKMTECNELSEEETPIRLFTTGEYLQVSLDPNCKTVEDIGCTNYNYIHDLQSSFWTITKHPKDSSYVYSISSSGVGKSKANTDKKLRFVILLNPKTIYLSGSGTLEDPYMIK